MTNFTDNLRLTLQETGENDGTWGDVANAGVFELIEDAVAGQVAISLTTASVILTSVNGATDQARFAILDLTGAPGSARDVTVPSVSKHYVVRNSTTGSQTITIKTAAGSGFVLADGETQILWCDGVDVFGIDVAHATTADTATTAITATNATQLGGVAAALYARLDVGGTSQIFTRSQSVERITLADAASVALNAQLSNAFVLIPTQNFTLQNPTSPTDGQTIRIIIKQDVVGNRVITWGTQYKFGGGVPAILSTGGDEVDYFSFEYYTTDAIWIGGGLLDLS
jgi:hypothetical protein